MGATLGGRARWGARRRTKHRDLCHCGPLAAGCGLVQGGVSQRLAPALRVILRRACLVHWAITHGSCQFALLVVLPLLLPSVLYGLAAQLVENSRRATVTKRIAHRSCLWSLVKCHRIDAWLLL